MRKPGARDKDGSGRFTVFSATMLPNSGYFDNLWAIAMLRNQLPLSTRRFHSCVERFELGPLELKENHPVNELTQRLSEGSHPVTVGGPDPSVADLRDRVEQFGYVSIKFTGTRGGTDLGVRLDLAATDLSAADFGKGTGSVHFEGTLNLNGDPVRCVADIDLATLNGTGHLVLVEEKEAAATS
jgi:hypothetical protein